MDDARQPSPTSKLADLADLVFYAGVLNLLLILGTVAGGIVLGWSPALAAGVATTRARLHGDGRSTVRRFASEWRQQFVRANTIQAPANVVVLLLVLDISQTDAANGLRLAMLVGAAFVIVYQLFVVTMDAHYDLRRSDVLRLAGVFMLRSAGAPLVLAASLALIALATLALPGLLPVLSLGAACYLATALCLSFYTANDRRLAASTHYVARDE